MDVINSKTSSKKIKSFLVFFCAIPLLLGCLHTEKPIPPVLEYENGKAVRVLFKSEAATKELSVFLLNKAHIPILGNFSKKNGYTIFTPVIPFASGHEFGIAHKGKPIASFTTEKKAIIKVPEVVAIYPKRDTVPVNILKMYVVFSQPMQHVGNPLDFITVFDQTESTEVSPFLDIAAGLWNKNHTRLTLWFDPGRIKTALIPNKEKGLPLKQNHTYTITLAKNWKSSGGIPLAQSYSKTIHAIEKDVKRPNPDIWTISNPKKDSKDCLEINFNETLDPVLALESIKVFSGASISGNLKLSDTDDAILFEPTDSWKAGDYQLLINPVLEDLAGNNLKNLFDADLRNPNTEKKVVDHIEFSIE